MPGARKFVSSSSQYVSVDNAPISGGPCTIAAWVRPHNTSTQNEFVNVADKDNSNTGVALGMRTVSGYQARLRINTGDGHFYATGSGTASASSWYSVVGRVKTATSKIDCALNGSYGSETTYTNSWPSVTFDRLSIGRLGDLSPSNYCDADIAHVAIWDVLLNQAETDALAAGVHPRKIRPESLVSCPPLWGTHSPEIDLVSGRPTLNVSGGGIAVNGPPVAPFTPNWAATIPFAEAVSGITGTSTTTNAPDTQSAGGTLENAGTSATTNASDTQAAAGELTNSGTASSTNADDAHAAAGELGVVGSAATSNENDAHAAAGELTNSGTSSTTNADDTHAAAGTVVAPGISGAAASTNAPDAHAAAGTLEASGTATSINAPDTHAASGALEASGTAASTNANDAHAAAGAVTAPGVSGAASSTDAPDTQAATGQLANSGAAASINANDTHAATGIVGTISLEPGRVFTASTPLRTFRASIPLRTFKAAA